MITTYASAEFPCLTEICWYESVRCCFLTSDNEMRKHLHLLSRREGHHYTHLYAVALQQSRLSISFNSARAVCRHAHCVGLTLLLLPELLSRSARCKFSQGRPMKYFAAIKKHRSKALCNSSQHVKVFENAVYGATPIINRSFRRNLRVIRPLCKNPGIKYFTPARILNTILSYLPRREERFIYKYLLPHEIFILYSV
jgi:hypothetical protein